MEQELWFTFDGHGSTRVLIDVAGAIAQLFAYDAYGQAIGFNPAEALTEFLYSGEQFDAKIGQQYLRARYYDPATGTFNRLDPFFGNLNDPQSLHNYLYCHADPVSYTDPSGKLIGAMVTCGIVGSLLGGVLGAISASANNLDGWAYWQHVGGYAAMGFGIGALAPAAISLGASAFAAPVTALWIAHAGYGLMLGAHDALLLYNHFSNTPNEDVLGLILLTRWAFGSYPGFIVTNWMQWGLGVSSFDTMGVRHMSDVVFGYSEIQNAMNTLRPQLSHYGQEAAMPNDVSLSFGDDGWLRWILNDVKVSGKVIDHRGVTALRQKIELRAAIVNA